MGVFSSKSLKKTQRQNKLILHFNKNPKSKKRLSVYKIIESQDYNDVPSSPYPIINNEEELKKMEYIHKSFKIFWGNNFSAPVKEVLELDKANLIDDIVSTSKQLPLNSNDSTLGRMGGEMILDSIKSLAIDGIGNKEYESIVAELDDPHYKPYLVVSRICAKKVL
ncbi:16059_t:CDS:2 [Entrophospora sp. SA101]|nr:16059_t:CDS:2 [Entrophospora sp. SA101]